MTGMQWLSNSPISSVMHKNDGYARGSISAVYPLEPVVSATLDAVARAWSCLLADPLPRGRMGQNGRRLVQK